MSLLKTSLHEDHLALNAKMAPFAGFDMPLQYSSVKEEVLAVREHAGVFDVSHMGEFFVQGPDAVKFVDYIMTNDFKSADMLKAVYSPLCRDNGTVIDDLIAYKLATDRVLICVNASNIEKDWNWISTKTSSFDIKLENHSNKFSLLALQGPKAELILRDFGIKLPTDFPYYSILETSHEGEKLIIARTGYTGEDGFEVFSSDEYAKKLWNKLIFNGVKPCGLAARDVLRVEVCYPLYGHEINDNVTPLDAGLAWTVKLEKADFIGKNALAEYKPKFQMVKLSLERGIPREGYEVLNAEGEKIGTVTSGTMSVVTGKGVCLALIEKAKAPKDKKYLINIRNTNYEANFHAKAFVNGGHK
ncbi:MAG: glycine cleavage system aminomethyltransferase GcvT [Bacteriovorax sp.]|nr:glycine cleavage system aminomethyltransferase GcvT [Bacteriovorax sp.]